MFNALSYADSTDKIFLSNNFLSNNLNELREDLIINKTLFANFSFVLISLLDKKNKYTFEWNSGISSNEIIVYLHLFHSFLSRNKFKFLLCACFLLKRFIIMFPHGINLYGLNSYNSNKTRFYNTRNFVNKYYVDSNFSKYIAHKLFKVEKYKILSSIYCLDFSKLITRNIVHAINEDIIIILPKIRRMSSLKLNKLLSILNKYKYNIILLTHPNDAKSSLYTEILNGYETNNIILKNNIKFTEMQNSFAIIDAGSSFFIIAQYFNNRTYRYNVTIFNNLILDDCFEKTENQAIDLPIFNYKKYKINYS